MLCWFPAQKKSIAGTKTRACVVQKTPNTQQTETNQDKSGDGKPAQVGSPCVHPVIWFFSSHSWLRYFHQSFLREWLTNAVPTTEPPPAMLAALSTNNNRDMPVSPELLSSGNLFSNLKFEGSAGEKPRGRLVHRATPPTLHSVFTGPFFSPLPRYFYLSENAQQPQTYFLQVEDLSNEEEVN